MGNPLVGVLPVNLDLLLICVGPQRGRRRNLFGRMVNEELGNMGKASLHEAQACTTG